MRRAALVALPALALGLAACDDDDDPTGVEPSPTVTFETSFEQDFGGFQIDGDDLDSPPVDYTIERSGDETHEGSTAMMFRLDNVNDKAKIWIERAFGNLEPNTLYTVEVDFEFATADWGDTNLWTLFADVDAESPDTWADFESDAWTTDTGNNASEDVGFVWDQKTPNFSVQTDADGTLHLAIGVWGTYEVERSYFIDEVNVTITES